MVTERQRLAINRRFEKRFKDVVEDEAAYNRAKRIAKRKFFADPHTSDPWGLAAEVGNEAREWKRDKERDAALAEMKKGRGQRGQL